MCVECELLGGDGLFGYRCKSRKPAKCAAVLDTVKEPRIQGKTDDTTGIFTRILGKDRWRGIQKGAGISS